MSETKNKRKILLSYNGIMLYLESYQLQNLKKTSDYVSVNGKLYKDNKYNDTLNLYIKGTCLSSDTTTLIICLNSKLGSLSTSSITIDGFTFDNMVLEKFQINTSYENGVSTVQLWLYQEAY